ncbi:MAG: SIMPL domain-containing protein [Planctomycetia bacterium]|nr:SIMPL domain-containing protein [Planctomycetia bacterium]
MLRFAAALPALLVLALAAGAEEARTITVKGQGTVKAKPDTLVMTFAAKGKAEKAGDAIEKLNKNLKQLKDDLGAILAEKKAQGAKVEDTGVSFAPQGGGGMMQVMLNGRDGGDATADVTASSQVRVTVPGVDGMKPEDVAGLVSALLDKGRGAAGEAAAEGADGGFTIFGARAGGESPVRFEISDPEAALSKAWDEAVRKARARAETIASRLGLAVGGAVRVRDLSQKDAPDADPASAAMRMIAGQAGAAPACSGETELKVELEIEFELKKAEK